MTNLDPQSTADFWDAYITAVDADYAGVCDDSHVSAK